jgi:hypothetical protein
VNQIEEGHAQAAVTLGVAHHESQVPFDEPPQRRFVLIALDAQAEFTFFARGESRQLRDRLEIRMQRIGFGVSFAHGPF